MQRLSRIVGIALIVGTGTMGISAKGAQPDLTGLVRDLSAPQPATREQAAETLGQYGPVAADAVPALAGALKDSDQRVRHEALLALERIGAGAQAAVPDLKAILEKGPASMKLGAVHALTSIGPDADPATDALMRLAKGDDPSLATAAVLALVRIHPDQAEDLERAVPQLIKSLSSKQSQVRNDAVAALGEIGAPSVRALIDVLGKESSDPVTAALAAAALGMVGPDAAPAIPALTKALASKSEKLREQAAHALAGIGPAAKEAVPALADLLTSKTGQVRAIAANALGNLGEASAPATSGLIKALTDPDVNVRRESAQALGEIGPAAKAAVPSLIVALSDDQGAVTMHAAEALGRIGPASVPALTKAIGDPKIRGLAIMILAELGPPAKAAAPSLIGLIKDPDKEIRREAIIALAQIGPDASQAVPALLAELKDEKSEARASAAYALVKIGAEEQVLPILMKTISDKNDSKLRDVSAWGLVTLRPTNMEYVRLAIPHLVNGLSSEIDIARRESVAALARLGNAAKVAAPDLAKLVETEKNPYIRNGALMALGEIGPGASAAVPAVLKAMSAPEPPIRYTACYTLGKIGPASKEAVPVLVKNLKSKDPFLPIISAWSLVHIDPKLDGLAESAVPLLTRGLKLPEPQGRIEAITALESLGTQSKSALPELEKLAKDSDEGVRKAAAAAIRKIKA